MKVVHEGFQDTADTLSLRSLCSLHENTQVYTSFLMYFKYVCQQLPVPLKFFSVHTFLMRKSSMSLIQQLQCITDKLLPTVKHSSLIRTFYSRIFWVRCWNPCLMCVRLGFVAQHCREQNNAGHCCVCVCAHACLQWTTILEKAHHHWQSKGTALQPILCSRVGPSTLE